jgi:hypothetical protein
MLHSQATNQRAAGMRHEESLRFCQNDVIASHYESGAVPAEGLMLSAGLADALQGVRYGVGTYQRQY